MDPGYRNVEDDGRLTDIFVGREHEGATGTLESSDLTAAQQPLERHANRATRPGLVGGDRAPVMHVAGGDSRAC